MKFTFKLLALAEMAAMVTYQEKINSNARSASFGLFHKKIHLFPSKCVYFGPFITTRQWTYIGAFYSSVGLGGVEFQRVPSYNLQLPTADIGLRVTIVSFTNPLAFKWGGEPVYLGPSFHKPYHTSSISFESLHIWPIGPGQTNTPFPHIMVHLKLEMAPDLNRLFAMQERCWVSHQHLR